MFVLLAGASGQTLTGTEQQVTTAAADQFDPAISGNIVVYTDFSGVDADVWYTDLSTGVAHPVTTAEGDQQLTGVSGNLIVFTDWRSMDVLVFNVDTGVTDNLTNGANSNSMDPAIHGNLVVWTDDRDGNAEIYARDLSTGEERRITDDLLADRSPSVGDGIIAWERCQGWACEIVVYDWASTVTQVITNTDYSTERFPDVWGRTIVFQREQGTPIDKDVAAYHLDTGTTTFLERPGDQENAHISGDFVSFNDSVAPGLPHHIGLWQLSTGKSFGAVGGTSGQYLNDIDGNRIVYTDTRAGTLDIWMFTFHVEETPADTAPPTISGATDLVVEATSRQGAIVSFAVSATDDVDPAPVLSCTPPSGAKFPIGTTPVTCTATDASGNSATASFNVSVRAVGPACHLLRAFVNHVNAQTGKTITPADAAALLRMATRIGAVLGCSS